MAQVGCIKALAKFGRQSLGQLRQQALAINSAFSASLLEFNDMLPDLPAGFYLDDVDGAYGLMSGLAD